MLWIFVQRVGYRGGQKTRRSWLRLGDDRGSVAPIFAASIAVLVFSVTAALELGRWATAQADLQVALDAGVLAGAARLQTNQADTAGAIQAAREIFSLNRQKSLWSGATQETIDFEVRGKSVVADGEVRISTLFSDVFSSGDLPLRVESEATITNSMFELSLMLDVTGSMCDYAPGLNDSPCSSGSKLDAMKLAAKQLINTMLATEGLRSRVRVSLVPFSDGVRLPSAPRAVAAGPTPAVKTYSETGWVKQGGNWVYTTQTYYYHPTACVAERTGPLRFTDDVPGPGSYLMTAMREGLSYSDSTPVEFGCSPGAASAVMPLTNNKDDLVSLIDGLSAKGGTAGQLGTAWAWYTLSPNWKDVWDGTSDDPAAYPAPGDKTIRKIAVLMTDGDYNNQFSTEGYRVGARAYQSAANGSSADQALSLCAGMKDKGIEVYTVGFEVSSSAATLLSTCATSSAHAFLANSGEELVSVFQGIGERVLSLHLSR